MLVIIVMSGQCNSWVMNDSFHSTRLKTQFCQVLLTYVHTSSVLHFCKNLRDINGGQSKEPLPDVKGSFVTQNIQHGMTFLGSIQSYVLER